MKKKYRSLFLIPVILLCTLFGCHKEKAELLFEDTEKIIEEDLAENSGENAQEESGIGSAEPAGEHAESMDTDLNAAMPETGETQTSCMVHVCGAVEQPGVYELSHGSRIYQAIECAGGLRGDADPDYLNQADFVSDGEKIYVPTCEEVSEMDARLQIVSKQSDEAEEIYPTSGKESQNQEEQRTSGLVNLNTASEELLCTLPGIGSGKAKSIIAYREEHGSFERIESVMNVAGIKDGLFQKIKAYITV